MIIHFWMYFSKKNKIYFRKGLTNENEWVILTNIEWAILLNTSYDEGVLGRFHSSFETELKTER